MLFEQKQLSCIHRELYGVEGRGNDYLQNSLNCFKSRSLAERVVNELNLTYTQNSIHANDLSR